MDGLKTLWKARNGEVWQFYCPMCRVPRRLPYRSKPSLRHVAQVASFTSMAMLLAWPWLGAKGAVMFVPSWIVFEAIYRARTRTAVRCTSCGFDPFLYMNDAQRARTELVSHWRRKYAEKGIPYPGDPDTAQQSPEA